MIARPISYPGGWTVMQMNGWELSRFHAHYSFQKTDSLGVNVEKYHDLDRMNYHIQWNRLLQRRNTRYSQANLYFKLQTGFAFQLKEFSPGVSLGVAGDWETRRYFVSYGAMCTYAGVIDPGSFHQQARFGIAPYIGDYGSLHTWLMVQFEHHLYELDPQVVWVVMPMVRLFKGVYLIEFGLNDNMKIIFNWVIRF